MTKIENLESAIQHLSVKELAIFRKWFAEYDAAQWDRQIETDAASGKLDGLADTALADQAEGRSRKL